MKLNIIISLVLIARFCEAQSLFERALMISQDVICLQYSAEEIVGMETSNEMDNNGIKCLIITTSTSGLEDISVYPNLECLNIYLGDHRKLSIHSRMLPTRLKYLFVHNIQRPTKLTFKKIDSIDSLRVFSADQIVFATLPEFLYSCHNLEGLFVFLKDTGSINMQKVCNLKKLKHLYLFFDSNVILFDSSVYSLFDLEELIIFSSESPRKPIVIDNRIGNLRYLKSIGLEVESIPDEFWNLRNIEHIEIVSKQPVYIDERVGQMKNLKYWSLNASHFPDSFFTLKELESFYNSDTIFNICQYDFSVFPNLTTLSFYQLNDSTINTISKLKGIRYLYVDKFSVNDMDKIKDLHFIERIQVREEIGIEKHRLILQKQYQGRAESQ